jgi:DNA-binding IclR family transcriptional regulator
VPRRAGGTGDIQAVHRVAEILRLFTVNQPKITVAEAAAQIGLNRTTVHRYFGSLVLDNILEHDVDEPAAFVPGRLLLQLGAVAHGQRRVLDVAPRHMRLLSLETELTVVLSLWGEAGAVVSLVSETGTDPILITVRVGTTLDLDSAQTKLFAAFLRDHDSVERYLSKRGNAERRKFESQLGPCRARGTARNDMPSIDAVVLAAAVFDEDDIAATVALVGTTSSLSAKSKAKELALVRRAYKITEEMGGVEMWRHCVASIPT